MQQIQQSPETLALTPLAKYSVRQRLLSGSITLAMSSSAAVTAAGAHVALPTYTPVVTSGPSHIVHQVTPTVHTFHPATTTTTTSHAWHAGTTSLVTQTPAAGAVDLNSTAAIFSAGSLAGFSTLTLDIGGKQTVVNANTQLTGAELVAAQQVLSGAKQTLVINAHGVATGGDFFLNKSTVSALDVAVGGVITGLDVSKGVVAIDSLSNLSLSGSLANQGTIDLGAATKGQTDVITAGSIINSSGALIASAPASTGLAAANVSLASSGTITNSGKITSAGDITLSGNGGALTVNGTGGTVQAANAINFNNAGANGNITLNGGNYLSQAANFNAGTGTINANVGQLTGVLNGNAAVSHITAATANMDLGNLDITGDPTFFNTAGNIVVSGTTAFSSDVAIVASGNVSGGGGTLDTSAGNGTLTIIAGANFTTNPAGAASTTSTSAGADTSTVLDVSNSTNAGLGSKTGGYIDLSGITFGEKGTAVSAISTGTGDVTMVAYKGTGANSGSIVATGTTKSGGASTITTTGNVTLIGGGAQITAQNITGDNVTILAGTPTLTADLSIQDGVVSGGSYVTTANSATAINLTSINATGAVAIATAGKTNSTAAAPIALSANSLAFNGTGATSSLYATVTGPLTIENSNLATGGVLSLKGDSSYTVTGNVTGTGTVDLVTTSGTISGAGVITGAAATLTAPTSVTANTAVNALTVNAASGPVSITETASPGKALTLNASTDGGTFTLTSSQTVNVKGNITTTAGDIDLTETGNTSAVGLGITSTLKAASGNITLTTTGSDRITSSKVIAGTNITVNGGGAVGTAGAPLPTDASAQLTVNGNTSNAAVYVKDSNTGTLNVDSTQPSMGGVVGITSAAGTVNVGTGAGSSGIAFSGVTVSDAVKGATVNINASGGNVGDGTGAVKVTSAGPIEQGAGGGINGTAVTLVSTAGNIGDVSAIDVSASSLTTTATKGEVLVNGSGAINVLASTSLGDYSLIDSAGSLNIVGNITSTEKNTGTVSLTAQTISQGSTTAFLVAPNVSLITNDFGSIGTGSGAQAIQTKAGLALSIGGGFLSTAYVNQTGNLTLNNTGSNVSTIGAGALSVLNLSVAAGEKLTVATPITWDTNNISAPASLTINSGGSISGTNATLTSPIVVVNSGGSISVLASGTLSFVSPSTLSVTGAGTVTLPAGSSLSLNGQTGITLGSTTAADPLATGINSGALANLTIFTKGVFSGAYSSFATQTGTASDSISITASSLKNTGTPSLTPFVLSSNNVTLALTGNQTVTLDSAAVTSGNQNYEIESATAGSTVNVSTAGALTANPGGLSFTGTGNNIALSSTNKLITTGLDSTYFTTDNNFNSVTLASPGTFTVGATPVSGVIANGIAGSITANNVTVSAPTNVIVASGNSVSANQFIFNTGKFSLNGTSSLVGTGVSPSLTISGNGGLTISGTGGTNNLGGTYQNITSATFQAVGGAINTGNLFLTTNGTNNMLDSGSLTNLALSASTGITLSPKLGILQVANGGNIYISSASLSSPGGVGVAPQQFLTLQAVGGTVSEYLTNNITLGKAPGNLDINVGGGGTFTVSTAGILTVNEVQNVATATLLGSMINVNSSQTASGTLTVQALGTPISQITETGSAVLAGGTLVIGQGLPTMPTTSLNISSGNIELLTGALNLTNTYTAGGGDVSLSQLLNSNQLQSLNFVNNTVSGSTLIVNTILAVAGNINIVDNNGGIFVQNGSTLQTTSGATIMVPAGTDGTKAGPAGTYEPVISTGGNITLLNTDTTAGSGIEIGNNVVIQTAATLPTTGQVSIVVGPSVPTTGLLAGTQASPNPTLNTITNGGAIYFTTTKNPTGSIQSDGQNNLNANGTSIVFNGSTSSTPISLDGGDTITADPVAAPVAPVVSAASNVLSSNTASNGLSSAALSSLSSLQSSVSASATGAQLQSLNWSLPTTTTINANLSSGIDGGEAGISDSDVISVGNAKRAVGAGVGRSKVLTGGVSNIDSSMKTLKNGATLISPKVQTTLNTDFGSVHVAAGSVVMVMAFEGGLAVYDLHDAKSGAVVVKMAGKSIKLAPGQNAILTNKAISSFEQINPVQAVAYRGVVSKEWTGDVKGFQSEFDVLSMMRNVGALRDMVRTNDPENRKAINSILKTSAILSQLGGTQYEYMIAPQKTAMLTK